MEKSVIIDTGPIVAFLNRSDSYHSWVKGNLDKLKSPLITCEAVISEACFLVSRHQGDANLVLELVKRNLVTISFQLQSEIENIKRSMKRYKNIPMSLADSCLVRMSELHSGSKILTMDSDFSIYRKNGRQVIPLISPSR